VVDTTGLDVDQIIDVIAAQVQSMVTPSGRRRRHLTARPPGTRIRTRSSGIVHLVALLVDA